MHYIWVVLICLVACRGFAQGRYSAGLGLGLTDNANYEESDKDGDLYLKAHVQGSYRADAHNLGLRLAYADYQKENAHDSLSWRLSDSYAPDRLSWKFSGALLGRNYLNGASGFTETSFNHVGWDFKAEQNYLIRQRSEIEYGPGLRARYYSGASDRSDHQVYGYVDYTFEASSQLVLGASSELGILTSSDSDFSYKNYDITVSADYAFTRTLSWYSEASVGSQHYSNRTVDVVTSVVRRRGAVSVNLGTANEVHSQVSFFSELTRTLTSRLDSKLSLSSFSQNSKSGYQNYNVTELFVSLVWRL